MTVAAHDINGDGRDDIVTGTGEGSVPVVRVFGGMDLAELDLFFAHDPLFLGGVRVG